MNNIAHSIILNTLIKSDLTRAQELAILEIIQPEVVEGYQTRIAELEEENARLRASEAKLRNTTNEATERARVYQETNRTLLEQLHVRDHVMAKSLLDFVNTTNKTNLAIGQAQAIMLETATQSNEDTVLVPPTQPKSPKVEPLLVHNNLRIPGYEFGDTFSAPTQPDDEEMEEPTYAHEILPRSSRHTKPPRNGNNVNGNNRKTGTHFNS